LSHSGEIIFEVLKNGQKSKGKKKHSPVYFTLQVKKYPSNIFFWGKRVFKMILSLKGMPHTPFSNLNIFILFFKIDIHGRFL